VNVVDAIHITSLLVVADLNALGLTLVPDEAQAPLVIDAYAVLSCPVTRQGFKMVSGWYPQIFKPLHGVEHPQLPTSDGLNLVW
jgi:hypothetical protein